jgi:hypothetical protein
MTQGRPNFGLPPSLGRMLDAVRRRALAVKVAEFPVLCVSVLALAWLIQGAVDRWLELSWATRAVLLALDAAAVLTLLWFFAIRPLRRRMDRRKAALLVERAVPSFRTSLISAVEFAGGGSAFPESSRSLVERLLADTAAQASKQDLAKTVVRADRLKRFFKWMTAAVVLMIIGFALAMPLSPLLAKRILLSKASFPDETKVVGVSGDMIAVAGNDVVLAAKAEGVVPAAGRLVVSGAGKVDEVIPVTLSRTDAGVFSYTVKNVREPFAYRFELHDGVGASHQVAVRIPPTLSEIKFTQIYPKHTGLPETAMSPASLRLLEGSKLRIEASASEPLQSALLEIKSVDGMVPLDVSGDGKATLKKELTVPESGWKSFSIHLTSAAGEPSANDPVYRVELIRDRAPTVVLSQPKKEVTTVITGAKVPLVFKISDDFGIRRAALSYRVFRPGTGDEMIASEEGEIPVDFQQGDKSISRTFVWDLSLLVPPVPVGSSITCWIEAEDNHPQRNKVPLKSAEKIIRVVSEQQKREELLELLGERAKDIERLYELQRGMNERTDDSIR